MFTSTLVVVVVVVSGLWSAGTFFAVVWWGSKPWWDLIGVSFSIVG